MQFITHVDTDIIAVHFYPKYSEIVKVSRLNIVHKSDIQQKMSISERRLNESHLCIAKSTMNWRANHDKVDASISAAQILECASNVVTERANN